MTTQQETEVLQREVRIAARPETIFPYLIDPALMVRWMGVEARAEARPGGIYRVNISGKHIASGTFVAIEPNRRVVFTWGWEGIGDPEPGTSIVEITLTPDGNETILRLRHSGLTSAQHKGHAVGWDHYLPRLQEVAVGGDPGPDPWARPSQQEPTGVASEAAPLP